MREFLLGGVLLVLWIVYFGATGFFIYQVYEGDPHHILRNYVIGTAFFWVMLGSWLWQLTDEL